jgi:DNA-binding transcriptional LysR family regulator
MAVDLNRLRHIVTIARTRSFSRAAEDLNITQPALSRSIASFEERFGLRLFDRSRAGVSPTAVGKLVIAEAERMLRVARDLDRNLGLLARGESGELAIGIGPLLAMVLHTIAKRMLQERPGVHLHTSIRSPEHLVKELLDDQIELVFGNSWTIRNIADIEITLIGTMKLAFVVRADHPLVRRSQIRIEDLAEFPQASAPRPDQGSPSEQAGVFTCENFHVLRDVVLDTDCVWLASPVALRNDIIEGRLLTLDVLDLKNKVSEVAMVHRRGRTLSPAAVELTRQMRSLLEFEDRF